MPLNELSQYHTSLGPRLAWRQAWDSLLRNTIGLRGQICRRFARYRLGESSRYTVGQWVQVLDQEAIQSTLDAQSRLRGLLFLPAQRVYCGGVYRVQKVMLCIADEQAILRPISRTILLEGVFCSGPSGTAGCGRHCALMFRDEWVKPAPETAIPSRTFVATGDYVRVRSAQDIRASLDRNDKRDGVMFMPEMYQWAGMRFRVAGQLKQVFEHGKFVTPPRPIYHLEGLRCSGAVLGRKGPCDLSCSILWHADWVRHDP